MGFDLSQAGDLNALGTWEVRDRDGVVMQGVTITTYGADSDTYKKAQRRASQMRLRQMGRNRQPTAKELEEDALDILVAVTHGWTGFENNGAPLECNPANVREIYQRAPWIREQQSDYVHDRTNFAVSDSSKPSPQ